MATGRSNKLVGQTGEYLVAAELSRRGLITTTFTGNVPHFDIVATDESGKQVLIQVKAARKGSWQFANIRQFCNINFKGKRQVVGKAKTCPVQRLVVVFVNIEESGNDNFYICTWEELRDLLVKHHRNYLKSHDGVRPKRWDSLHCAINEKTLAPYLDKWKTVNKRLR